jgi:hypothetical protein
VREAPPSSSTDSTGARSCAVDPDAEFSVLESIELDDDKLPMVSKDFKIKYSSLEELQRAQERIGTVRSQRPPAPYKISWVASWKEDTEKQHCSLGSDKADLVYHNLSALMETIMIRIYQSTAMVTNVWEKS